MRLFLFPLLVLCLAAAPAAAQVDGMCPLPKEYYFDKSGGENATPESDTSLDQTLHGQTISGDVEWVQNEPHYEENENENPVTAKLIVKGEGAEIDPSAIRKGAVDSTTASCNKETCPWSPKYEDYHIYTKESPPSQYLQWMQSNFTCWVPPPRGEGTWQGLEGWKIKDQSFAYHYDGPTLWGQVGGIGNNTDDSGDEGFSGDPKHPDPYKFVVPSVPYNYFITSVYTAKWEWVYSKKRHPWRFIGTPMSPPTPPICSVCRQLWSLPAHQLGPGPHNYDWNPPDVDAMNSQGVKPDQFYSFGQPVINDPGVADAREGNDKTLDKDGVSQSSLYDNGKSFSLTQQPAVISRSSIRIHDMKRIAHISFGDGSKCEWNTTTGEKITETDNHEVEFQLFDNAPHMRIGPTQEHGIREAGDNYKNEHFKAIFWYEDIVYDYLSKRNPALGLNEVFYTPKFVLKRGAVWEGDQGFQNFLNHGTSQADGNGGPDQPNPLFTRWDLKFKTDELFNGAGGDREDVVAWHYADTSLGDQFGTPRWERGEYDGEKWNSYGGLDVCSNMENRPLNMIKGRGPLKCFFEVRQLSQRDEKANGAGNEKFDCEGKYFFHDLIKGNGKYQEQVKYNPEVVEYIQEPGQATVDGGPQEIDPENGPGNQAIEKYEDKADSWKGKYPTKNGKSDEQYQAFGRILIKDNDRPNVGIRIYNKSSQKYREIYYRNSIDKLEFYDGLKSNPGKKSSLRNDEDDGPTQYTNEDEEWRFEKLPGDIGQGETKLDALPAGGDGYGLFEDVELEMSHNDLKGRDDPEKEKLGSVLCFYAHDNIDGQRMKYKNDVDNDYYYKGVASLQNMKVVRETKNSPVITSESYADGMIPRGYSSWFVHDNSFSHEKWLEKYMDAPRQYFLYPNITFNNPNAKSDGSELNPGASDFHVSYMVNDRAGNTRKFFLRFFVKAIDVNINTLERQDRKQ